MTSDELRVNDPNKKQCATAIFLNKDLQVLLYLRDQKSGIPFPNTWDLLGGRVEPGETPDQCIERELFEEIEYRGPRAQLFKIYNMDDRIEHTYWLAADLDLTKTPLHEGQKLRWFSEHEISDLQNDAIAFGFRQILLDFFHLAPWKIRADY